jgi:hypothetical protein
VTLAQIETMVYESLGDLDDLDPRTFGSASEVKLRGYVNRAYKRICSWKFPSGEQLRFPSLEKVIFLSTSVLTGSVTSATSNTALLGGIVGNLPDNRYADWLLEISGGTGSGQKALVISSVGTTGVVTLHQAWKTTPDGTSTYKLYKRFYTCVEASDPTVSENISLSPVTKFLAFQKVTDLQMPWDLKFSSRDENFSMYMQIASIPMSCFRRGNTLYFDMPVNTVRTYRIEIIQAPDDMTLATDVPQIPEQFHECIVLYARWIGLERNQEWSGAYATKRDLEELMSSLMTDEERQYDRSDAHVEVL